MVARLWGHVNSWKWARGGGAAWTQTECHVGHNDGLDCVQSDRRQLSQRTMGYTRLPLEKLLGVLNEMKKHRFLLDLFAKSRSASLHIHEVRRRLLTLANHRDRFCVRPCERTALPCCIGTAQANPALLSQASSCSVLPCSSWQLLLPG